jgi:hypothetical protein
VTPTRELAGRLNSIENPLIEKPTRRYINDLQDHTVYIAETIGTFREMLSSLENTYHAGVNMRMGQVMKLLTVISTIFIPLTFVVGRVRYELPTICLNCEWRLRLFCRDGHDDDDIGAHAALVPTQALVMSHRVMDRTISMIPCVGPHRPLLLHPVKRP